MRSLLASIACEALFSRRRGQQGYDFACQRPIVSNSWITTSARVTFIPRW
jgi:hypothetical protein